MTTIPDELMMHAERLYDEGGYKTVPMIIAEAILAERDQAKQTARAALRFVEKALNDISDSEQDAIDSLERARLELIEIVEV